MNIKNLKRTASSIPAVSFVRKDPKLAAALSKIEPNSRHRAEYNNEGNRDMQGFDLMALNGISSKRAKRNSDNQAILKLLPDISLSKQILVSCILSPKDMMSSELIYLLPKNIFNPALASSLTNRIKSYFEDEYDIKKNLALMLEEALFDKGSYPVAVIPESAIDSFINGAANLSTESFKTLMSADNKTFKPLGILGSPKDKEKPLINQLSLENFYSSAKETVVDNNLTYHNNFFDSAAKDYSTEDFVAVTDNFSILRLPSLANITLNEQISKIYSNHSPNNINLATESFNLSNLKDRDLDRMISRNRQHKYEHVASIKPLYELNRKTIGEPLVMKLPSEAVIPVHAPGDVRKQVAYFILLDQDGNPIEHPDGDHDYSSLNTNTAGNLNSNIVKRVGSNFNAGNSFAFDHTNQQHISEAARVYGQIVEKDLLSRIKNGVFNSSFEIASNEEVYRIMLARVLAKKFTQILFLPAEYVTYIAFKYTDDGLGKSLLDDSMTINTLRATIMFTDMIGQIKNAVGRTKVKVHVPENDPNPTKTIERIVDEIVRSRSINVPMGVSNPNDIFEYIQRVGYEFEFDGNPLLPDLKIEFEQVNNNYQGVDEKLVDNLRDASIAHLGLTPEVVTNGLNQPDFATTIVANNVLLSKRVSTLQDIFTPLLSDHMRKVAKHSQILYEDLKKLIADGVNDIKIELEDFLDEDVISKITSDEDKASYLVERAMNELIGGLYVELPKPDSVTLDKQLEDLNTYSDALDKVLDAYISEDLFTDTTAGDISTQANTAKAMIKAYFVRKWLADKGIFSEIAELTSTDEDKDALINLPEVVGTHMATMTKSIIETLAVLKKVSEKSDTVITDKIGELEEEEVSSSSGGGGDFSGGGGFDDFGGDGFDLESGSGDDNLDTDLDAKPDETTGEETPPDESSSSTNDEFAPPGNNLDES